MMSSDRESKKILKLAEHISKNGLDPSELQLVYKDNDSRYIVIEGNRRLTALKLLMNPDVCPVDKLTRDFRKLHEDMDLSNISDIECGVVGSREDGSIWLELKHTGENNGAGRVDWSGDIRDEYRARQGSGESVGRQVRKFIVDNDIFSDEVKDAINAIPVTSLTRLFASKPAQDAFQLKVINRVLTPIVDINFIVPSLEYAIILFKQDGMNVDDIYHDEDRKAFISRIPEEYLPLILKEKKIELGGNGDGIKNPDKGLDDSGNTNEGGNDDEKPKPPRVRPPTTARKYLIDYPLSITQARINDIYKELKQRIEVDRTPNAASILYRVFLELSCDYYIEKEKVSGTPVLRSDNNKELDLTNSNLSLKVDSIAVFFEKKGLWKKPQTKALTKRAKAQDTLGSIAYFNEFVHNTTSSPIASELKLIANDYRPLLEAIWD